MIFSKNIPSVLASDKEPTYVIPFSNDAPAVVGQEARITTPLLLARIVDHVFRDKTLLESRAVNVKRQKTV